MGDVRTSFVTLEDVTTKEGKPLHSAVEGDDSTVRTAHGVLPCKKVSDGTLQYFRMDDAGNVYVTSDEAGTCKRAGTNGTAISGNLAKTTVCEISLTVGKKHRKLSWTVSNRRDTLYEIELIDDPGGTPTVVQSKEIIVGAGCLTDNGVDACFEFDTTGLTSPVLRLSGTNFDKESDFRGDISVWEDAA